MHYTAMASVTFAFSGEAPVLAHTMNISSLSILGISIVPVIVPVVALVTWLVIRLRQQRVLLHELFEQAPQAVILMSVDNRVIRVNKEFTRIFGYRAQETLGRGLDELIVPAEARDETQKYTDLVACGQRVDAEGIRQRKDGSHLCVSIAHVPVSLPGGQVAVYAIYHDINERKQAEEEIKKREAQLREAQHLAQLGSWEWDIAMNTVTWSDELYRIFGVTPQEFDATYEAVRQFIHPEDREMFDTMIERAQRVHEPYTFEYRIIRPDGTLRILQSRGTAVLNEAGQVVRLLGTGQDITERKQAEIKLKRSESQLAQALHIAKLGGWYWDLRTERFSWSDELYRLYGLRPHSVELTIETFMELIHPEDRATLRATLEKARRDHQPFTCYHRAILPEGCERIFYTRASVILGEDGVPLRVFGTSQDVTERKQAEEALRCAQARIESILNSVADIHILFDREWRYLYVNEAAIRAIGRPREQILGRTLWELYPDIGGTELARQYHRAMDERIPVAFDFHYPAIDKWWENRFYPALEGLSVFATDITERKHTEEKLRATTEQLRALSARIYSAKEEEGARIAREIHDELGAALTILRWEIDSFDKNISAAGDQPQPHILREKIAAMTGLTDTISKTVRRIASELRPSVLDDLGLVEAIEWQAQQFEARTGIICHCDCSTENLAWSREQATAVFRIFQEALTNVFRHAQASRVDITLKEKAGKFVLTISDNGSGITEDEKSDQLSLGLLGMRERAHLVGAQLDITGIKGRGTMVTVQVPVSSSGNRL